MKYKIYKIYELEENDDIKRIEPLDVSDCHYINADGDIIYNHKGVFCGIVADKRYYRIEVYIKDTKYIL